MTKTENLSLDLLEQTDDAHALPAPFNANFAALDAAIAADRADSAEALAALVADVGAGGHNCRVAYGTYTGTGTYGYANPSSLSLDFCPVAVLIASPSRTGMSPWPTTLLRSCPKSASYGGSSGYEIQVQWAENSVSWYGASNSQLQLNESGYVYYYVAFGCDA